MMQDVRDSIDARNVAILYIFKTAYILKTSSRPIHLPGAFAKTKKATNILRLAIDVSFLARNEEFLATALSALKQKKSKKTFFTIQNHRL